MFSESQTPLVPAYRFNAPCEVIELYSGPVGGLTETDIQGRVDMAFNPTPSLSWRVFPENRQHELFRQSQVTLKLRHDKGDVDLRCAQRSVDRGWSNGAELEFERGSIESLLLHWFNLPWIDAQISLLEWEDDERWNCWTGRWVAHANGWVLTLDIRPDHQEVWSGVGESDIYVMTHVMEARREDGEPFTAEEAKVLLSGLHVGISFAMGCWVAPMLPVGQNSNGENIWEEWREYRCDPARILNPGWWFHKDSSSLSKLLDAILRNYSDPIIRDLLRLQMILAVESTRDVGFVEQRILNASAGLESVLWRSFVHEGPMSERQYKDANAFVLLRVLLKRANISASIDSDMFPVMANFVVEEEQAFQDRSPDGPSAVFYVRNRIMHPKGPRRSIYRYEGLVTEVWLLARYYLSMLILHSLDFEGQCRDLRIIGGCASDRVDVPWSSASR